MMHCYAGNFVFLILAVNVGLSGFGVHQERHTMSEGLEMKYPAVLTPKRCQSSTMDNLTYPGSPPLKETSMYPWNWGEEASKVQLSPSPDANRRGRPRADVITSLIIEGSTSPSAIKCRICNRVFPREKSLQAHMRTHTGECLF